MHISKVDPFIPIRQRPPTKSLAPQQPRVIQDVKPARSTSQGSQHRIVADPPVFQPSLTPSGPQSSTSAHKTRLQAKYSRLWRVVTYGVYAVVIVSLGLLAQVEIAGEILIALYGIVALIRNIKSRTSFTLALIAILAIMAMLVIHPDPVLTKIFATYGFLFLVVGVISLAREAHD